MSDHYPCLISYKIEACEKSCSNVIIEKCKFTDGVLFNMQQFLLFHDWGHISTLSVNESYQYLVSVITEAMDKFAPKRTVTFRADERFCEPWMTVKIKKFNAKC